MASDPVIRQAAIGDTQAVADILRETVEWLEQKGMPLWLKGEVEPVRIAAAVREGLFFLAEVAGGPAGTVMFQLDDPVFWPEVEQHDGAYIHRLAIRRRHAGSGLSTAILRWAAVRTRSLGRHYLRLDCIATRSQLREIYERFGFRYHSDKQVGPYLVSKYEYDVTR